MASIQQLEYIINMEDLHEMMRSDWGEVISRKVGAMLIHKIPRWSIEKGDEIRETLFLLIEDLRNRLAQEGIGRDFARQSDSVSVPIRSRKEASFLAALIAFVIPFLDNFEEQLRSIDEGIDWARIAGDSTQEGVLYYVRAGVHVGKNDPEEVLANYRKGIDVVLRDGNLLMELYLRSELIEMLLRQTRVEDVEKETEHFSHAIEKLEDPEERGY